MRPSSLSSVIKISVGRPKRCLRTLFNTETDNHRQAKIAEGDVIVLVGEHVFRDRAVWRMLDHKPSATAGPSAY
jgi:hypothetical protein